jgi:hypothetical protein
VPDEELPLPDELAVPDEELPLPDELAVPDEELPLPAELAAPEEELPAPDEPALLGGPPSVDGASVPEPRQPATVDDTTPTANQVHQRRR